MVRGADLVAHVARRCDAATFAGWIEDGAAAVFHAVSAATDAPLGFAVLTPPDFQIPTGPEDIELRRIYTLAALHGQGLGSALLDAAIGEARGRGHRRLLLGTHPDNTRARRFYERYGFREIGRRRFQVGDQIFNDPVYALAL